jgi:hypothetical protein
MRKRGVGGLEKTSREAVLPTESQEFVYKCYYFSRLFLFKICRYEEVSIIPETDTAICAAVAVARYNAR